MEIAEKILSLRKSRDMTQEQLAEQLGVSRQSVSKWESGQAVPELDKVVALAALFDVATDYLLQPSAIDELSVKTQWLEKQQQQMLAREIKRGQIIRSILYSIGIYLLFLAIYIVGHFYWEIWNPAVILAEFLAATAAVVFVWVKVMGKGR